MASWPATLPKPKFPYGIDPVDQTIRTDMESGAARTRRRTTARNDRASVSWIMTDDQMATFRTWFDDASTGAAGGASWFSIDLPVGTTGIVTMEARFVGTFKASALSLLNWDVSATLEVR